MVDNTELMKLFVRNFIQKDKRDMCFNQLSGKNRYRFANKLNHSWEDIFNMNLLYELRKKEDGYFNVRQMLQLGDTDLGCIISNSDADNTILTFSAAFEINMSSYSGSLLINMDASKLFLKTEDMGGRTPQFIGKAIRQFR